VTRAVLRKIERPCIVSDPLIEPGNKDSRPLWLVTAGQLEDWLAQREKPVASWVRQSGFQAKPGSVCLIPDGTGGIAGAVAGVADAPDMYTLAAARGSLPSGPWRLEEPSAETATAYALGWQLAGYRFDRYRTQDDKNSDVNDGPQLEWPEGADRAAVERAAAAVTLVRDLVNTPAADLGPAELATAAQEVAAAFGANYREIVGDALLDANYPMIHAVGHGSDRAPRLIDISWGDDKAPRVALVGKGVCFDSGGLDIKPSAGMRLMKKDMGGAAAVLGLARMIMAAHLNVRLRVLIPAVENSVSGRAFRPGDVLTARNGMTVEIGNTDAEGRLVLADALVEADSETPDLLIDCATLTGAARVALGPEVVPFYTADDDLATAIARQGEKQEDPVWRMPLWQPYREMLDSSVADIENAGSGPFGGSITAALFLADFVKQAKSYAHFDMYAWNPKDRPGRPKGGEAQAIRALFAVLAERYAE
jgi:leucyl aminopeptidase